jgi:hypothetical protein
MTGNLELPLWKPLNPPTAHCSGFSVGGLSVRMSGDRREDVALVPSLQPFRVETGVADVDIRVEWVDRFSAADGRRLFDSGSTWRLFEDEPLFRFDFSAPSFGPQVYKRLTVDKRFSQATLEMNREFFADVACEPAPLGYPLDELLIMHRLTQEKAIELHGCGIAGADGIGNLFVGHSGAGKSTTTRLWCASEEVEILSDDRIIVRWDSASGKEERTSRGQIRMYGTPWHGEAAFASPARAPLTRIMVLEHGRGNVLTRLSPSQAVAELFARSFVPMHRHEYVESALEFLQQVAGSVPCYRYSFEPHQGAVERILELRD